MHGIIDAALAELPLALFTTLVPFGAGAFVFIGVLLGFSLIDKNHVHAVVRSSFAALLCVVLGFIASFCHLKKPLLAYGALCGITHSPLSQEILAGVLFLVTATLFFALSYKNVTAQTLRFLGVVNALVALICTIYIAKAYMVPTIASWNTPLVIIQMLGLTFFAGGCFGSFLLQKNLYAGCDKDAADQDSELSSQPRTSYPFKLALIGATIGFVAAWVALLGHHELLRTLQSSYIAGTSLASGLMPWFIGFGVLGGAALILLCTALRTHRRSWYVAASIASVAAIFVVRLVFYAIQLSVAL